MKTMPRHTLPSSIFSLDDDPSTQNCPELISLLCSAAQAACSISIDADESKSDSVYFNVFPGEHYRLLAGLLTIINPRCVVDIGTYTGMSTKIMMDYAPRAEVHSFDIVPWQEFDTHLRHGDKFTQHLDDLSNDDVWERHASLLRRADLVLCDGPKDDRFERIVIPKLTGLVMVDDIRFENMHRVWRGVTHPKIDATSFGHWSGTGLFRTDRI